MAYAFGKRSRDNLLGVHPDMVKVVNRALQICSQTGGPDFSVIEGVRTEARQKQLYAQGRTTPGPIVTWTLKSNHFRNKVTGYGHAVDLFPGSWNDVKLFEKMAQAMFQASKELGIPIRWGADWDRDGNFREKGETDSPHFELAR
ncbi:M15 family metallopeptidase [Novosphingobium sp. NPDC080210]|uniref:M15 family metallopeptidase n=1 Tax=Novosphingobium sp. NPDC080210 TaxID=3390596 RepID=UPI003D088B52